MYNTGYSPMVRYIKRTIQMDKDVRWLCDKNGVATRGLGLFDGDVGVRLSRDDRSRAFNLFGEQLTSMFDRSWVDHHHDYSAASDLMTIKIRFKGTTQ